MKIAFVAAGFLIGYMAHSVIDLRQEYRWSIELAEANCNFFALSHPEVELEPALIDCKLITDDDFLLTFEVKEAGYYVDCLPGEALVGRAVPLRNCRLYSP